MSRLPHFLCCSRRESFRDAVRRYASAEARTRSISLGTAAMTPLRCWESLRYAGRARKFELDPRPVFIVGHWQGGHSWMHQLLACDPQFSCVRLRHCIAASCFNTLRGTLDRFVARRLPADRGVDSMRLNLDTPQGDDFLLAGLTYRSFYYAYVFPQAADRVFLDTVLMDGVTDAEAETWVATYHRALQAVAAEQGRPRLVSRNASNTARLLFLLRMFPQARFIHMHRHPETLYAAQPRRWRALTDRFAVEPVDEVTVRESTLASYPLMMQRYLRDREQIPHGQLCEVRYEELLARPVETLREVYDQLQLGDFAAVQPAVAALVKSNPGRLGGHDRQLTQREREQVQNAWGFAFEEFDYEPTVATDC